MIVVTGAAGFIGSNLIKGLNQAGYTDILAVDDLTDGHKYRNLAVAEYNDYWDYQDFLDVINKGQVIAETVEAIFHEGACSVTTEWNGRYMMQNNYEYSKRVLHYCLDNHVPFLYASSAAVYGNNSDFDEAETHQFPLNVYGYSKWQFDCYLRRLLAKKIPHPQIVGLRYFNVYGPHEQHKGSMASVAFHWMRQLEQTGELKLFEGSHGYGPGEQLRDFVFVDDVVKVNLWLWKNPNVTGIFNVGTGRARSFNDLANSLIKVWGSGKIQYIVFPEHLKAAYQSYTQANLKALREVGYQLEFTPLEEGIKEYYAWYKREANS